MMSLLHALNDIIDAKLFPLSIAVDDHSIKTEIKKLNP